MNDLDKLLEEEREELRNTFLKWQQARANKDWEEADKYREVFSGWDSTLGTDGIWFPVFETSTHREQRARARMEKYGVSIYPYE